MKLLNQGFLIATLNLLLRTFHGHQHNLVNRYGIFVSQMIKDVFVPFVVVTVSPFNDSWRITRCVTRVTRRIAKGHLCMR